MASETCHVLDRERELPIERVVFGLHGRGNEETLSAGLHHMQRKQVTAEGLDVVVKGDDGESKTIIWSVSGVTWRDAHSGTAISHRTPRVKQTGETSKGQEGLDNIQDTFHTDTSVLNGAT